MQVQVQPSRREGSLIDSGPSERGWHRIESMLRCPRLYALQHIDGVEFPLTRPLVNGIMLHVALAHHESVWNANRGGPTLMSGLAQRVRWQQW